MIDNSSELNVKFDSTQERQLAEFKTQLAHLEGQVITAQNNLVFTAKERDKATKERIYQESLVETLSAEVASLEKKRAAAVLALNESDKKLSQNEGKIKDLESLYVGKDQEISARRDNLLSRENALTIREAKLEREEENLAQEKKRIGTAHEAFVQAVHTVTWK